MKTLSNCCATVIIFLSIVSIGLSERTLNSYTSYDQKDVDLDPSSTGLAAVWSSYAQDGDSGGIFAKILPLQGDVSVNDFQVNGVTQGNQAEPSIGRSDRGNTLIAWRGPWPDSDEEDIIARLFDPNGNPLTEDFRVNVNTQNEQSFPRVAASATGQFVVAWESEALPDRSRKGIACRIFDVNGIPVSDEISVSDRTYTGRYVDVGMSQDGDFVIVWLEDRTTDSIYARLFNLQGIPKGEPFQVNTEPFRSLTWPDVSVNQNGYFAVSWDGDPNRASDDNIHARLFDPNGIALTDEILVNTTLTGAQQNPAIALNNNNEFLVTWDSDAQSESQGTDVLAQYFDANGIPTGTEWLVNTNLPGDQSEPRVALTDSGHFYIAWQSPREDGANTDIYFTHGVTDAYADLNNNTKVDFQDFALFAQKWSLSDDDLGSVDTLDLEILCSQWLYRAIPKSLLPPSN